MFKQEIFSSILNKIVNQYGNITYFATAAEVGRSYLSKYINKKIPSPPSPKVLMKIANASNGLTTYNELMQICGYINEGSTIQSLDYQLANSIYNDNMYLLDKYEFSDDDYTYLSEILVERKNDNESVENQLNNFSTTHSNSKELYATLIKINNSISDALINLHKNGYLFPVPVYKNGRNLDLLLTSNIVDYINFNIPVNESVNDYFALLIDNDNMLPLLDTNDIAIIQKTTTIDNGQIIAAYSTTKECCIIGKLFQYDNIIEMSYLNAKTEKFMSNDIKFLGKVIKAEVKSAFK